VTVSDPDQGNRGGTRYLLCLKRTYAGG
jgi:hypothetical protein